MADSSKITPTAPQSDKALNIKDPATSDDTAAYHYPSSAGFTLKEYTTATQDTISPNEPAQFPGGDNKFFPSTGPVILKIIGTGFNVSQAAEPIKVFLELDGYLASVPPLPSSSISDIGQLAQGNAFGYIIKSPTELWIYCARLVFQQIWFAYDVKKFKGLDEANKLQLESGNSAYPLLGKTLTLKVWAKINDGTIQNKPNYFKENNFVYSDSINVTQSPFIITLQGNNDGGKTYPNSFKKNGELFELVYLYGHNLLNQKVMMVKTSSDLLHKYPSAIPQSILTESQSESSVKALSAQQLSVLDHFKTDYFLGELKQFDPKTKPKGYTYFAANGTLTTNGKTGRLPTGPLSIVQFSINRLPAGVYNVVVYNPTTGIYNVAPVNITISLRTGKIQIHDVTPDVSTLQNPSFTVNGFNFPTSDDIKNGAIFTVSLVSSTTTSAVVGNKINRLFTNAFLQISKDSPVNDKSGNGSINLTSDSQFTANFTNLHPTSQELTDLDTFNLYIEVTYAVQNPSAGKVNEASITNPALQVQRQPVIQYLTNTSNPRTGDEANAYKKSLVSVDQTTGQVIAYGHPGDYLYIVGNNFDNYRLDIPVVLIKGKQQTLTQVVSMGGKDNLSALVVKVDPTDIKGDATVEVKVGSISSEAFQYFKSLKSKNQIKDAKGLRTKTKQTLENVSFFKEILPYNQFDQHTLLNSTNTKVASSVALTLSNASSKESVTLTADLNTSVSLPFLPDQITVPANTPLSSSGTINTTFYFYNLYNVNISTPKIYRLQHEEKKIESNIFNPGEKMTVVGTGFIDGMRYNINNTGWLPVGTQSTLLINATLFQTFFVTVPPSNSNDALIKVSNENFKSVQSASAAGQSNGGYNVKKTVVNDKYSPLLKINQRLPAGIKMYAKGTQNTMTDPIDANMSIYGQITPFLGSFKTLLIVIRIIVCIIDVICALINPFQLIVAIIALMDCIIDLLSLFPQLAVPIMILSFLQNFVGFLQTFIQQIETYVFAIVNAQLALVKSQISQDFAKLAAAEQQAFGSTKQIRDVISFLEPALQIIQIFKDLLNFAIHFPCASNQGGNQNDGSCPPGHTQKLIQEIVQDKPVPPNTYGVAPGNLLRKSGIVTGITTIPNKLAEGMQITLSPGEVAFPAGPKTIASIVDSRTFTYSEAGDDGASISAQTIDTVVTSDQQATLSTMFCQAVAMQTATLQTMPGFNGLDGFGNPLPGGPLGPGSTSVIPPLTPVLPNISAAIECMNNYTDQIENALNAGQVYITTAEQGQQLVAAYTQCVQNLIDQTNQSLGDICVLAVSALNSELKVSPKGRIGPDLNDDFIKTKIGLPSTQPNDAQDAGLTLDLAQLNSPVIPKSITANPDNNFSAASENYGIKKDVYTPIIFQSTNKSGQRQSVDTIYFNADNQDVGGLISIGDILEIVGGTFNGLQFPITGIQPVFTAVRLTCKLDITFEQKLLVGEQPLPGDLSDFDVKIIAHLAGNDAVAVVPADDKSVATIQILARDHHGHEIGAGLANKVSVKIESGLAEFVPIIPSATTDVTGVIQEQGTHYIANLKANCSGTVIVSSSVCGIEFVDIGYHANDVNHAITTRKKTVKIIFTPPIPVPAPQTFDVVEKVQVPGTDFVN